MLRELQVRTDVSRKLHLPIVLKQGSVDLVRIQVCSQHQTIRDFMPVQQYRESLSRPSKAAPDKLFDHTTLEYAAMCCS